MSLSRESNKAFILGLDLREINNANTHEENDEATLKVKALFGQIGKLSRPVIVAQNGNCFGGGLEPVMACHLGLARRDARLGLPEIIIAAIPGFGGTRRLPKIVDKAKVLKRRKLHHAKNRNSI